MQLDDMVLVTILAYSDVVFIPERNPFFGPRHQVIFERRAAFLGSGVPWASDKVELNLDDAGRKEIQRVLEGVVAHGLVQKFRPKGAKTLSARLTDEGDYYARALVGLPTLAMSLPVLEELERQTTGPEAARFLAKLWVPETVLSGVPYGDPAGKTAYRDLEDQLLPALVRNLAVSNCSMHRHCWYSVNPSWRKLLPRANPNQQSPEVNAEARDEYFFKLERAQDDLDHSKPENERQIGEIPMSCSPPDRPFAKTV